MHRRSRLFLCASVAHTFFHAAHDSCAPVPHVTWIYTTVARSLVPATQTKDINSTSLGFARQFQVRSQGRVKSERILLAGTTRTRICSDSSWIRAFPQPTTPQNAGCARSSYTVKSAVPSDQRTPWNGWDTSLHVSQHGRCAVWIR